MPTALQRGLLDEILLLLERGPLTYEALCSDLFDVSPERIVSHLIELVEAKKISWTTNGTLDLRYPSPTVAKSERS